MLHHIDFLLTGHRLYLKAWSRYRIDFFISVVAAMLHDGSTLLLLSVIFANIKQLQGWSFLEILFIWGLAVITRNLGNAFFDVPSMLFPYVLHGGMDKIMVRPQPLIFQIATESGVNIYALGRILVGIAALCCVFPVLHLPWWSAFYLLIAIVSSVLLFFGMQLMIASLSFWFVNSQTLLTAVVWMTQFGQYPIDIFALPLRILFTWVLPYAMIGFFPAAFLLRGGKYTPFGLLVPVLGLAFFGLSMVVWRFGIRHYQSTGS